MEDTAYAPPSEDFMTIEETKKLNENKPNRHMADFIRKQLTKGYGRDTTYRHIVYSLTDEEIIEGQRVFNQENKNYLELKHKAAKIAEEEKASPFAKLTARALLQA
jgi:hypothetical protein